MVAPRLCLWPWLAALLWWGAGCAVLPAAKTLEPPAQPSAPRTATEPPAVRSTPEPPAAPATRELGELKRHAVEGPEGLFKGEVAAAAAPSVFRAQGYTRLVVPLGTEGALQCDVLAEPVDAGGTLRRLVREAAQRVEVERVQVQDVVALAEGAALVLEVRYQVDTGQGRAVGWLKVLLYASPVLPLVCTHDEVGYTQSFRRIATGLAESLRPGSGAPAGPYHTELHVVRLEGEPVGYEQRTVRRTVDGTLEVERVRSVVRERSPRELATEDTVSTEVVGEGGRLVSKRYARAVNGEVVLQVGLEHVQGPEYRYEGQQEGRQLSGKLRVESGLASEPGALEAVREQLLTGKRRELILQVYAPEEEATAVVVQEWRRVEGEEGRVTRRVGAREVELSVDGQGVVRQEERTEGGQRLEQVRTRVRGTL